MRANSYKFRGQFFQSRFLDVYRRYSGDVILFPSVMKKGSFHFYGILAIGLSRKQNITLNGPFWVCLRSNRLIPADRSFCGCFMGRLSVRCLYRHGHILCKLKNTQAKKGNMYTDPQISPSATFPVCVTWVTSPASGL